jgi:anti-sigma regulatory factor (Ser/Thr protein kinase)
MTLVVATDISEIGPLHDSVSRFCHEHKLPAEIEGDLSLALEEILMNVIRYGHPEGGEHEILVGLSVDDDGVVAAVEDDGVAFNPLEAPRPDTGSPLEERPIGGLGIHLIRNLMNTVEYRRAGGRNRLVLRKRVPKSD